MDGRDPHLTLHQACLSDHFSCIVCILTGDSGTLDIIPLETQVQPLFRGSPLTQTGDASLTSFWRLLSSRELRMLGVLRLAESSHVDVGIRRRDTMACAPSSQRTAVCARVHHSRGQGYFLLSFQGSFFSGNHQKSRGNSRCFKRTMVEQNGESTPIITQTLGVVGPQLGFA